MFYRLKDQRMMADQHIRSNLFRMFHRSIIRIQSQQDLLYLFLHASRKKSRVVPVTGAGLWCEFL